MYKKRIISNFIDFFIASFIVLSISWTIQAIFNIKIENYNYYYNISNLCIMLVFSFKDLIYKNKSIMKKRINLEVRTLDNKIPSKIILFLRNLTVLIFPIELLLMLLNKNRLGDIIFKTKVVETKKQKKL